MRARGQPVAIVVGTHAAATTRAEPARTEWVERITLDLPQGTVAQVRNGSALPEADVARRRHRLVCCRSRQHAVSELRQAARRRHASRTGRNLQETPS